MGFLVLTPFSPLTFATGYQLKKRYCKILATKGSSQNPNVFPTSLTEERCFTKVDGLFQIPTIRPAFHPSCQYDTCSS